MEEINEETPPIMDDEKQPMMMEENENTESYYKFTTDGEPSGAREENFFTSLSLFCCPKLSIY